MPRRPNTLPPTWSVADLLEHFGNIPAARIRLNPAPGTATEKDWLALAGKEERLYELVDGVLVEKPTVFRESCLAGDLYLALATFVRQHDLGILSLPDGSVRLYQGLIRIPDVAFVSWARLPGREYPEEPVPDLVPDLVAVVLRASNTPQEMNRKRRDYFLAGVRLLWHVLPDQRAVEVYDGPDARHLLGEEEVLDGGAVLPGFRLPLRELFVRVRRKGPATPPRRKRTR